MGFYSYVFVFRFIAETICVVFAHSLNILQMNKGGQIKQVFKTRIKKLLGRY